MKTQQKTQNCPKANQYRYRQRAAGLRSMLKLIHELLGDVSRDDLIEKANSQAHRPNSQ